jgi:hypothetical protein
MLEEYRTELEQYKKTDNYRTYQEYLTDFKDKAKQSKREPTGRSDEKISSRSESAYLDQSSASLSQIAPSNEADYPSNSNRFNVEISLQETVMPLDDGMKEVRVVLNSLGVDPQLIRIDEYPPEHVTITAIKAFLHGTGSLLLFWTEKEALDLVRSVYKPDDQSTPHDAIDVFAMSAVGSYCDGETTLIPFQNRFVHSFVYMMFAYPGVSELRRMRLFACLAICRFIDSIESARVLIRKWLTYQILRKLTMNKSPPSILEGIISPLHRLQQTSPKKKHRVGGMSFGVFSF